jgi:enoyl-CoA hydratase/carnithine racemase
MGAFLEVERKGRIAILRMNKPESMNAIGTHEDCEDICNTLQTLNDDKGVSCIILTGNGKAFSAGGNLKSMQQRQGIGVLDQPDSTRSNYRRGVQRVARALLDIEIPAIAAVNGHAVGLGCDLACLCDIRIAAKSALFSCSFIKVGIVPGDGGAWALQQVVGYAKAAELFLTGDRFDAAEAYRMGLVQDVVSVEQVESRALEIAGRIASAAPLGVTATLRNARLAARASEAVAISQLQPELVKLMASRDAAIAFESYLTKVPPVFEGR